jgi:hypothetical protein
MPREFRVEELPMPECNSILGVPMLPAERIISFLAVNVNLFPEKISSSSVALTDNQLVAPLRS